MYEHDVLTEESLSGIQIDHTTEDPLENNTDEVNRFSINEDRKFEKRQGYRRPVLRRVTWEKLSRHDKEI